MKKIFLALILVFILILSACNYSVVDVKYGFAKAMISLPDGTVIDGKLDSWRDYENSDQIQVVIDGTTYLVHSVNCVLYD